MKRNYTLLLFLLATVSILAQTPEKMSYQLVLRGATNTLLTNQQVGIQISILQTTISGTAVYTETQTATTNINGLVSLEIGSGTSSDNFSAIDWSAGPFFIKTATDASGGSNYSIIGTSQLMSVPFALYAKSAGNDELKENTANKSTDFVTDAASDVKFPSVKSVKTYVDAVQDDADANEIASTTSAAALQGYIDALEARITVLESASTGQTFYEDTDNDGYGDINSTIVASAAPNGYVSNNTDCNDTDATINPATVWYLDADADNYAVSTTTQCDNPGAGYTQTVLTLGDCIDNDAAINPVTIWYLDADGDNYAISTTTQCTSPGADYAMALLPLGDCDDTDVNINPGAPEMPYDGIDNDCNTATLDDDLDGDGYVNANDCNDTDAAINPATVWFIGVDTDGDTFFGSTTSLTQCESPGAGYLITAPATLDCDDSLATGSSINPDAIEVSANGIDDDCDGLVDEATVGELREGGIVFWVDPADNMHGKVCALDDPPTVLNWKDARAYSRSYTNLDTGTGVYSNWDFPSRDELQLMYANLQRFGCSTNTTVGGVDASLCPTRKGNFSNTYYWSITYSVNNWAWSQHFDDGFQFDFHKVNTFNVRAVRAF
jgi:hypothetical protein